MIRSLSCVGSSHSVKYPVNGRTRELDDEHMFIKDIETLNHEKKIRGFFTVTVYIFAVSFLAILLSIYYIFVWSNPNIQAYCWYMKVMDNDHDMRVSIVELKAVLSNSTQGRNKMNSTLFRNLVEKSEKETGGFVQFGLELIDVFESVGNIRAFMQESLDQSELPETNSSLSTLLSKHCGRL